ncbi:MAG TPA: hypothetical protein VF405_09950, partial [Gammaproteobacteria bacterium]
MVLESLHRTVGYAVIALAAAVAGCGGGGGDASSGGGGPPVSGWVSGSFLPASSFAGRCVNPRSGTDPQTGQPYNESRGTATDENNFLRSWSNDLYLWYNEIVDRDPSLYTTAQYFDQLKTGALTASGRAKDRFHFTYSTAEWLSLSQSGVEAGYGPLWAVVAAAPPRRVVVAYTEPGSPAANNPAFARGAVVLTVDGVDVVNSNTQAQVEDQVVHARGAHLIDGRDQLLLRGQDVIVEQQIPDLAAVPVDYGRHEHRSLRDGGGRQRD